MDANQVMQEYNEFERKQPYVFGGEKIVSPDITKFVSNEKFGSYISYFKLQPETAQAAITREKAFFTAQGVNFEWKTYSTDQPSNIGELLVQNGFEVADRESFMALDLDEVESAPVETQGLVEVFDEQGIRDAIAVQQQVWQADLNWQFYHLLNLKQNAPEMVSIYVVYEQGQPVTSAWITFNPGSPFAGIWGGSTLERCRGRGYYSLLLNQRIQEAKARGKKYLIIDASDMSRSIVEKKGFQLIATTTGYDFVVDDLNAK